MTLTIKRDRNWSSFQLANSAPPLSVTGSAIAPSARMLLADARIDMFDNRHAMNKLRLDEITHVVCQKPRFLRQDMRVRFWVNRWRTIAPIVVVQQRNNIFCFVALFLLFFGVCLNNETNNRL